MNSPKPSYAVSESPSSSWFYHIRLLGPEGLKLGGGAPPAICGARLGWDTKIPLTAWGYKSHVPLKWCSRCAELVFGSGQERV